MRRLRLAGDKAFTDGELIVLGVAPCRPVWQVRDGARERDHLIGSRLLMDDSGHHQTGIVPGPRDMTAPDG
ncbi:MAG TPA: hypothetical protein VIJ71_08065 [Mycobacteriales bacterium]